MCGTSVSGLKKRRFVALLFFIGQNERNIFPHFICFFILFFNCSLFSFSPDSNLIALRHSSRASSRESSRVSVFRLVLSSDAPEAHVFLSSLTCAHLELDVHARVSVEKKSNMFLSINCCSGCIIWIRLLFFPLSRVFESFFLLVFFLLLHLKVGLNWSVFFLGAGFSREGRG